MRETIERLRELLEQKTEQPSARVMMTMHDNAADILAALTAAEEYADAYRDLTNATKDISRRLDREHDALFTFLAAFPEEATRG